MLEMSKANRGLHILWECGMVAGEDPYTKYMQVHRNIGRCLRQCQTIALSSSSLFTLTSKGS